MQNICGKGLLLMGKAKVFLYCQVSLGDDWLLFLVNDNGKYICDGGKDSNSRSIV